MCGGVFFGGGDRDGGVDREHDQVEHDRGEQEDRVAAAAVAEFLDDVVVGLLEHCEDINRPGTSDGGGVRVARSHVRCFRGVQTTILASLRAWG